ncbi:60 kDa SS-A/Ro ribonucleoprotein [Oryzias melastigma]|uniref:Ro60, Y RNA binding protein n=1 Tax=Oryzias melastigma TaxID=30732 RepID=A0A3B3BU59_ORYME|nr:60 kDa SS-A/Ro ribonucleoprotein [Oryzias melastigma]
MEASASSPSNLTLNATGTGDPWEITVKTRLRRFLCYGSEGNVFTARDKSRISLNNAEALLSLLQEEEDGAEVVEEIRRFMQEERAVRLDPSFFALALCSQHSKRKTREAAFKALKELCRDPAHLFAVVQYKKELREGMNCGIWGRALRTAVSDWYNKQDPMALAAAVTRCKQREGWSHKDLLRLSHTKPSKEAVALISKYVTKGWTEVQAFYADKENSEEVVKVLSYLEAVEKVKHSCDETEVIHLIGEHKLEMEQLLTQHLQSKQVWKALLKDMPLHSVLKILGRLTANEVLEPGSSTTQSLCERIRSEDTLMKAKIHPFSIFLAMENYKRGQGYQGRTKWEPNNSILKALESAFYSSFMNVEPVGKRFLVAVDQRHAVDVSMSLIEIILGTAVNTPVTPTAAAITTIFVRTEADTHVLVFSDGTVVPCPLSPQMTLAEVTAKLDTNSTRKTDCSLPITWATENGKCVDVFIILTNNPLETLTASPVESLKKYRETTGAHSKLVVCGLTSSLPAITETGDRGFLSMCGFDLGALTVIRNFSQDLI